MSITEVEDLRPPREDVVAKLRELLAEAEAGRLRGFMYAGLGQGGDPHGFGQVGAWDVARFAMGVRVLGVTLDRLITEAATRTP